MAIESITELTSCWERELQYFAFDSRLYGVVGGLVDRTFKRFQKLWLVLDLFIPIIIRNAISDMFDENFVWRIYFCLVE